MSAAVDAMFGLDRVPGVARGRWVYPTLARDVAAHRLYDSVPLAKQRWGHDPVIPHALDRGVQVALCGTAAGGWQDTASCPPGAAPFDRCEPCELELHRLADAALRAQMAEPVQHEPVASPPAWRPAGFAPVPATGAGR